MMQRILVLLFFFLLPSLAEAATLYLAPASGSYRVGDTISLKVYVSSDTPLNAVSGSLSFSRSTLSVESVRKTGSLLAFWSVEPTYSNSAGTVDFEGVSLGSSYAGERGTVVTVDLKAKAPGAASVSFVSGSVLAHDGSGTNILEDLQGANFTIASGGTPSPEGPAAPSPEDGPVVTSTTHPNPARWYSLRNASLSWVLPEGVTAVRTLLDERPRSTPSVLFDPPIGERVVNDLPEGVSYFHVQLREGGTWGGVTHFPLRVDATPPRITISEALRADPTEPSARILVNASDALSGIDRYAVTIGNRPTLLWSGAGKTYITPPLPPGTHTIVVRAVDGAGNIAAASVDVTIAPLEAPTIRLGMVELDGRMVRGIIGSSTYPGGTATLFFGPRERSLRASGYTDDGGSFAIPIPRDLRSGLYRISAIITDARGAESDPSSTLLLRVGLGLGLPADGFLTFVFILLLLGVIVALGFVAWYGALRLLAIQRSMGREVREAELAVDRSFELLRDDIAAQMRDLGSKRKTLSSQKEMIQSLRQELEEARGYIKKELGDISAAAKQKPRRTKKAVEPKVPEQST